jgi:hypothetical protein
MGCIERVDCHGFLDEIEFVATNDVRFRARALVSRWPVVFTVLFDFRKELVGPKIFQLDLDVLGVFIQVVYLALHFDCRDGGFRAVDD